MKRVMQMVLCLMLLVGVSAVSAKTEGNWQYQKSGAEYDTMSLATYEIELALALEEEQIARQQIAVEQAKIDSLELLLLDLDLRIVAIIQEKYLILGITEADVQAAEAEIREIRQNLENLLALSPEELQRQTGEINKNEARIVALKRMPVSYLWKVRDQIKELDDLLARVKAKLPDSLAEYTVKLNPGKRDCLYRIAGFDDVYGDVSRWPELYRANKDQIEQGYNRYTRNVEESKYDRPEDLIFPGQVFDIPR